MALNNYSSGVIAKTLNEACFTTRKGKKWTHDRISAILSNPVYCGKIRWFNKKTIKTPKNGNLITTLKKQKKEDILLINGLHEPIITEIEWNQIRENVESRAIPIRNNYTIKNPFAGILICKCGKRMRRKTYKSDELDRIVCEDKNCDNVSSQLEIIEERLIEILKIYLKNIKYKKPNNILKKNDSNKDILEELEKNLIKKEEQLTNLQELLEQKVYSIQTFLTRSKSIESDINKIKKSIVSEQNKIKQSNSQQISNNEYKITLKNVIDSYYLTNDMEIRNELLKSILYKVIYIKNKKGCRCSTENMYNFELILHPKIK